MPTRPKTPATTAPAVMRGAPAVETSNGPSVDLSVAEDTWLMVELPGTTTLPLNVGVALELTIGAIVVNGVVMAGAELDATVEDGAAVVNGAAVAYAVVSTTVEAGYSLGRYSCTSVGRARYHSGILPATSDDESSAAKPVGSAIALERNSEGMAVLRTDKTESATLRIVSYDCAAAVS
jgi:hypothetical protein